MERDSIDAKPTKPRLGIRSILSLRESSLPRARKSAPAPKAGLTKSNTLTVLVDAPRRHSSGPCRFVATPTKLGSGAYGAVLLGRDLCTQAPVAIKFIPDGRMRTTSLEREVGILQRLSELNHPSLVKFYGRLRPADVKAGEIRPEGVLPLTKPYTTCHALVMEAARGGELFDHVVKCEGLREADAGPLFAQLCDAVRAAHEVGITHRDLKLENVLLVHKRNKKGTTGATGATGTGGVGSDCGAAASPSQSSIKLIDWGLAHQHDLNADGSVVAEQLHSRCGSRSYMAPEVTNREISSTIGYDGFAADAWSLGVCLFAMHLAFFPFEQANPAEDWRARRVVEAQIAGKSTMATILSFYPQKAPNGGLSEPLLALLDRLLLFDPTKRATLSEVLCSEWLAPHVPARCYPPLAHPVRLAARLTSNTSSTETMSEGAAALLSRETSRDASRDSRLSTRRQSLERQDSTGTTHTTSSIASTGHHRRSGSGGMAGWQLPAAAVDPATGRFVPPPPPSPLPESAHVQVVVAGASSVRAKARAASPLAKHGRYPSSEADANQLASLMAKACKVGKVSPLGSPRKPDRDAILINERITQL